MNKELPVTHEAMLSRKITQDFGDSVEVREEWDLTHKECPMVVMTPATGTGHIYLPRVIQYSRVDNPDSWDIE